MVELFELLQEGDLSEDGHGDAVLRQREAHLLQGHDRVRRLVARPVHRAVRACEREGGRETGYFAVGDTFEGLDEFDSIGKLDD